MANKQIERCFLCGKVKAEVNQLIRGKFGYVCDECISYAYECVLLGKRAAGKVLKRICPALVRAYLC